MRYFVLFYLALLRVDSTGAEWRVVKRTPLAVPEGLEGVKIDVELGNARGELHFVDFAPKTHTVAVMDDPEKSFDLASAAKKRGALVAVNGGYFHPDRTPLGLVIRQGREIHSQETASLLSGLVVATENRISLVRAGEFRKSKSVREALQAGPFLVDGGRAVKGLNATRFARRTFVFARENGRFGLGVSGVMTLAELAVILSAPDLFPESRIYRALNLDGGSSTGLWIGGSKPLYLREGRDVRNFLGIVPRSSNGG